MPTDSVTNNDVLAILLGASHWPELGIGGGSSFENSFDDFRAYLRHPDGLGLPKSHIYDEFDSASSPGAVTSAIIDFFRKHRANDGTVIRKVLLYLVGQGELFEGEFYFALCSSRRNQYQNTFFSASGIARLLHEEARPCSHYVIIDACHSGAAGNITWKSPKGACLLASARASELSLAKNNSSQGRERTQFTGAMLDVLTGDEEVGDSESHDGQKPTFLSFDMLSNRIQTRVERLHGDKAVLPELRAVGGPRLERIAWLPLVSADLMSAGQFQLARQPVTPGPVMLGGQATASQSRPAEPLDEEAQEYEPFTTPELLELLRALNENLRELRRILAPYPEAEVPFPRRMEMRTFKHRVTIIERVLARRGILAPNTHQS